MPFFPKAHGWVHPFFFNPFHMTLYTLSTKTAFELTKALSMGQPARKHSRPQGQPQATPAGLLLGQLPTTCIPGQASMVVAGGRPHMP